MADGTVIFDTDVLIWCERKNLKAADVVNGAQDRYASVQTYMEFLQGARSHQEMQVIKDFFSQMDILILPFTENIGHRASIYIEEHAPDGLRSGDAIIAATAVENNMTLISGNQKHFKPIKELKWKVFNA